MKLTRSNPAPAPSLVQEIDDLRARLEARLESYVEEERAKPDGTLIPAVVHRNLLLRSETNFFAAMRRLLIEREAQ